MRLLTPVLMLCCLLLGACGQKGPLVPPAPAAANAAGPAPAAP